MKKKETVIGKMVIFSFSDAEEYMIDRLKSVIEKEHHIEYAEIISKSVLLFSNLEIRLKEREVYRNGKQIPLSNQEFLVFQFLVDHHGWVRTKEEIYNVMYGEETVGMQASI